MSILKLTNWDKTTGFLHFGLALTVTMQLILSQLMHYGVPNAFLFHEIFGLTAVVIITIHWIWNFVDSKQHFQHLFPWSRSGLTAVITDIKQLIRGQLPQGGNRGGLPGLIHGLGFLAVTGMAASGLIIFITIQMGSHPEWIRTIHSFIANFVWIYWFGHVGMALLHHLAERINRRA